jgi:acetyl esterase/lipase
MKRLIVSTVYLMVVSSIVTAQNNLPPEVREMARKVMMPVVYKVPGMDKVKVVQNLKYTTTDDPNVLMDLYLPPGIGPNEKRPAVILVHGGVKTQYTPKDWGIYTTWGRLIAASGFVGVTFTHRLEYPNKSLEKAALDVRAAIAYVRGNAGKYNVDKDRICLIAYSAGGPMLSLAMRGDTPYVRCLVGFYAFMDIQQSDYRKTESFEIAKSFSPISYLQSDPLRGPPMFIARAGRDEVPTMADSIDRFVREALAKNISLTFMNHPQGVHGFDNQNDDERSREIIRSAIAFIKDHLNARGSGSSSSVEENGEGNRQALIDLENSWLESEHQKAALETILASDFLHPVMTGEFLTKEQHIYYSSKYLPPANLHNRFENLKVRIYGTVGIVNGIVVTSDESGKDLDRTIFTDVFAFRDGRWQAINAQENKVQNLPGRR